MPNYNANGVRAKATELLITGWPSLSAVEKESFINALATMGINVSRIQRLAVILDPNYDFSDFTESDFERTLRSELKLNPLFYVWVSNNIPENDRSYYC